MKKEELIKKGLLVGIGLAAHAQEKTEKFVWGLVKKGNLSKTEGKKLVGKIYQEADKSRKKITRMIESELKGMLKTAVKKPAKKPKRKARKLKRKAGKKRKK